MRLSRGHTVWAFMEKLGASAVLGDQQAADTIKSPRPVDVVLHDRDAGGLPRLDRLVQFVDRRLFEAKRLGL